MSDEELILVYDLTLRRPACAILQTLLGGTPGLTNDFPSESWLVTPTPDLQPYRVTRKNVEDAKRVTEMFMRSDA